VNLRLTSPLTRGDDVQRLQAQLKRKRYLQGEVDGVYGPDTARAVYKAKFWLGYRAPDQNAADLLLAYLKGDKKTTAAMQARAKSRHRVQGQVAVRTKMFREAKRHVGVKENPAGSNRVLFSNWYALIGPWCAMFVTYCGVHAGAPQFKRGNRWAYVPYVVSDARAGRNGLAITYQPKQGDLVCFDWDRDGVADHIGFFDRWLDGGRFKTLEGNTAVGNDSNGGEVMARDRDKSQVIAYVHVGG
jgi:CHAP domain/Putative peptidoglycan binding domain